MFFIDEDKTIHITRGDVAIVEITAISEAGDYIFAVGDVVRISVFDKKGCDNVVLRKDTNVEEETTAVEIYLDSEDTKFGEVISKTKDYWYEIELNPGTAPQTIIGYDEDGAKVFKLYPEGGDESE